MTISVVIPAHNEEKYIGRTLECVVENAPSNLLEIIVVNNASTDNTARVAAAFPKVRVVNETKKGITQARQAGLNASNGELVACVDADTWLSKQWFEILNREFEQDSNLVCLSGPYWYREFSPFKNFFVQLWYLVAKFIAVFTGYLVQGGNFVVKRQALLKAGGFDTSIAFYGEDTDIAQRMHGMGKVKFLMSFRAASSARRIIEEGFLKIGWTYAINFFSIIFSKKPTTKNYKDIR